MSTKTSQGQLPQTNKQMPSHRVLTYSFGDIANNLSFMMTSMFLTIYITDIVGLSAGVAGFIYGVTKVWAGFTDLFVGNVADKVNTRWGRLRPFLLFGSTPLAIVFVLLFSVPNGWEGTKAIVWILLFDALFQLGYSFVNIPYGSLSSAMTQDPVDRSKLSGARSIASSLASVGLSFIVSPQFKDLSDLSAARTKFTITCIILAVIAVILYLICFANSREVVPRGTDKISFAKTFKMIGKNTPLKVLLAMALFLLTSNFVFNAVQMYYVRTVLDAGYMGWLMLSMSIGTILFASFAPFITRRWGKRKGYILGAGLAALAYLGIFFLPAGSLPLGLVLWFILGVGNGGANAMMFSMQADTVDYGEWKAGIRSEGGSYSVLSFVRKVGQGLGGWLGLAIIGWFGYVSGEKIELGSSIETGLRVATGVVPAVLAVVAIVIALTYRLDGETHAKVVEDLTERRTQSAIGAAKGVDVESTRVKEDALVGDGRTTLMRRPGAANPPIITLFGQRGSGATEIGPIVAKMLGVQYLDQAFSSKELSSVDKSALLTDNAFGRWMRTLAGAGTEGTELSAARESAENRRMAHDNTEQVLSDVEHGGVMLGRNGALILGSVVGTLHVRLVAPLDKRVERVMYKTGLSQADAYEQCQIEDRLRAELSIKLYQWNPNTDEDYDLTINTATTTYEQVAEIIVEAYRSKYPNNVAPENDPATASRTKAPIEDLKNEE